MRVRDLAPRCIPVLVLALVAAWPAAAQDINGGTSWNGWTLQGTSTDLGIYGNGPLTEVYQIYTTVFEYDSANPIPGTQAGFADGNLILGIGLARISGTGGYPVIKLDFDNNSFAPATSIAAADGSTSFSGDATDGDAVIHFPDTYSGEPSEMTIKGTGGNSSVVCGSYGCGTGLPGIRGVNNGNTSYQAFFDLTQMPLTYGAGGTLNLTYPLGTIGSTLTFVVASGGTDTVIQDLWLSTAPPPEPVPALGSAGLATLVAVLGLAAVLALRRQLA